MATTMDRVKPRDNRRIDSPPLEARQRISGKSSRKHLLEGLINDHLVHMPAFWIGAIIQHESIKRGTPGLLGVRPGTAFAL